MLKRKNKPVVEDDDLDYEIESDNDEEDDEEDVKPRKGKRQKKQKPERAPKERKPKGFFSGDAFQPYTGKICAIMYFVYSCASIPCFLMLLFGGKYAKMARNYMEETGDTEGVGFLAAGKAIRSVVLTMWIFGVVIIGIFVALSAVAVSSTVSMY